MAHLEELLPNFRKGAKIRKKYWDKNQYLYFKDDNIMTNNDVCVSLNGLDFAADWEFYNEPAIDWNYIVKNKCLCWFWDDDADIYTLGTLTKISDVADQFGDFKYKWNINGKYWKNCRPVRRDEVTFYEDKRDD